MPTSVRGSVRLNLTVLTLFAIGMMASNSAFAQACFVNPRINKVTANISPAIQSYMEYLPVDYNTNPTKKYALLIYIGGTGEMFQQPGGSDDDLCPVLGYSMPWRMNVFHFPDYVTDPNTGQQWSYLVIMPFVMQWEQQYQVNPGPVIDYALQHYVNRIDPGKIYITGMSRGTDNLMGYITSSATASKRIAAVAPVANCFPANVGTPGYTTQVNNMAAGNVHVWGIQCAGDVPCPESNIQNWVASLNSVRPGYGVFSYATFACEGPDNSNHYAWNHAYDPDYRPAASGNKNIYEWLIQFSQNSVLPIVLKDWNARLTQGKVMLEWTTSEELNTKEFTVQRATASGSFVDLVSVPAAISSTTERNYAVADPNPLPGQSLYRLVMKNQDGKIEYYPVKRILVPGRWTEHVIIPNPVNDGQLSVFINIERSQRVSVRLFDIYGKQLQKKDLNLREGVSENSIDVTFMPKGVYLVQVNGEDFKTTRKITIN